MTIISYAPANLHVPSERWNLQCAPFIGVNVVTLHTLDSQLR